MIGHIDQAERTNTQEHVMDKTPTAPVAGHSRMAKAFHWGFVVVFAYALTKQLDNANQLSDAALLQFEVVFAIAFLALLAVRYIYMRKTRPTALPDTTPRAMKLAARAGHLAMYISLAMIAISGLLIAAVFQISGPDGAAMQVATELHGVAVNATYASIALHVAAALFHRLKGDGIWSTMVPVWKDPKT